MFLFFSLSSCNEPGIFAKHFNDGIITIDVSGSSKQKSNGTLEMTKPEYAIYPFDKKYDWCSNCGKSYDVHPWITFSLKNRKMKFSSYFIRCGCCYSGCCCEDYDYCIYCCLYSWSIQISEDNKTWTTIHKIEKETSMEFCNEKTYKLDQEYTAKYVRLIQDAPCPGYPPCLAINKMEFYGEAVSEDGSPADEFISFHDDDDDISIIGHISKNGRVPIE